MALTKGQRRIEVEAERVGYRLVETRYRPNVGWHVQLQNDARTIVMPAAESKRLAFVLERVQRLPYVFNEELP